MTPRPESEYLAGRFTKPLGTPSLWDCVKRFRCLPRLWLWRCSPLHRGHAAEGDGCLGHDQLIDKQKLDKC